MAKQQYPSTRPVSKRGRAKGESSRSSTDTNDNQFRLTLGGDSGLSVLETVGLETNLEADVNGMGTINEGTEAESSRVDRGNRKMVRYKEYGKTSRTPKQSVPLAQQVRNEKTEAPSNAPQFGQNKRRQKAESNSNIANIMSGKTAKKTLAKKASKKTWSSRKSGTKEKSHQSGRQSERASPESSTSDEPVTDLTVDNEGDEKYLTQPLPDAYNQQSSQPNRGSSEDSNPQRQRQQQQHPNGDYTRSIAAKTTAAKKENFLSKRQRSAPSEKSAISVDVPGTSNSERAAKRAEQRRQKKPADKSIVLDDDDDDSIKEPGMDDSDCSRGTKKRPKTSNATGNQPLVIPGGPRSNTASSNLYSSDGCIPKKKRRRIKDDDEDSNSYDNDALSLMLGLDDALDNGASSTGNNGTRNKEGNGATNDGPILCLRRVGLPSSTKGSKRKERKATIIIPGRGCGGSQPQQPMQRTSSKKQRKREADTSFFLKNNEPEAASSPPRKSSRNNNKRKQKNQDDVIELLSDDDSARSSPVKRGNTPTRTPPSTLEMAVSRIAIGKKVFDTECKIELQPSGVLRITGKTNKLRSNCSVNIDFEHDNMHYFGNHLQKDDNDSPVGSFIALKVEPTTANKLKTYRNAYQTGSGDAMKMYLVIEFESSKSADDLLDMMELIPNCSRYSDESEIGPTDAPGYCIALKAASKKGKRRYGATKVTDTFVDGRPEDAVLLVYPFDGDTAAMEKAANGLEEASDTLYATNETTESSGDISSELSGLNDVTGNKAELRKHFLSIQVRDFERLCPGEFLNDTLIDFWIQWITRKADPLDNSVHCFSSHFFTTLDEEGASGVEKWTERKGINVFDKKFVFIPINENLHWSLCVVVNPGSIGKTGNDDPMTCLLFLDSLKAHRKQKVAKKVREWLNSEWQRIQQAADTPFRLESAPLYDPKIPYQNNSWDCGVFVCKYAYSVFSMRNQVSFLRKDLEMFSNTLLNFPGFKFDMPEIASLRQDIRILIERLSGLYLPWKNDQDKLLKEERRKEKQERLRLQLATTEPNTGASVPSGNANDTARDLAAAVVGSLGTESSAESDQLTSMVDHLTIDNTKGTAIATETDADLPNHLAIDCTEAAPAGTDIDTGSLKHSTTDSAIVDNTNGDALAESKSEDQNGSDPHQGEHSIDPPEETKENRGEHQDQVRGKHTRFCADSAEDKQGNSSSGRENSDQPKNNSPSRRSPQMSQELSTPRSNNSKARVGNKGCLDAAVDDI